MHCAAVKTGPSYCEMSGLLTHFDADPSGLALPVPRGGGLGFVSQS